MKLRYAALSLLLFLPALLSADVRLPAVLSDHAVIQRDEPIHIWGWASPGEKVEVSFRNQSASTTATGAGKFSIYLQPEGAGGPDKLTVRGKNRVVLDDVLVGEVWVASGQSNMEWRVERSKDPEKETAAADYPEIRFFQVKNETSPVERDDVDAEWQAVTPKTIPGFSAVAYFFARDLHQEMGVPFGILQSDWGGTPAEAWTTSETLVSDPAISGYLADWDRVEERHPRLYAKYQEELAAWQKGGEQGSRPRAPAGPDNPHKPSSLFNAMIAPITPYAIRGAIWYQGESNAGSVEEASLYHRLFSSMIEDWRRRWGIGDFPFLFVQLANYGRVSDTNGWAELRESQSKTLSLRNTGMAVTIDIGNSEDIHPKNKQDVGRRLALAARREAYGKDLVYSGPTYRRMHIEDGKARLHFDNSGGGLELKNGSAGFEIAGSNGVFHPAQVQVDGKSLLVSSPEVERPAAVRYAFEADPKTTLFNKEGLPASPFRTDTWR